MRNAKENNRARLQRATFTAGMKGRERGVFCHFLRPETCLVAANVVIFLKLDTGIKIEENVRIVSECILYMLPLVASILRENFWRCFNTVPAIVTCLDVAGG